MSGLVSIITPSYNTAAYIADTIRSVQAQTYGDWEMLIVDDCSTDETDEVVRPFLEDRRIRYFKNEKNSGAAVSRNYALRQAKGRWIAFLDSDDLWLPEKLEKQIAFMEENGFRFSYTQYEEIGEDAQPRGVTVTGPKRVSRQGMYCYCWPGCLTVMYDAEAVGLIQIRDIKKNNDYAMWLKICKKADCRLLGQVLAKYRRGRSGSISSHGIRTMLRWHYRLFREAEGQTAPLAALNTGRNVLFGVIKKLLYVKGR